MIKRTILEALRKHLFKKEISLIIGPRQAGKTTLMLLLRDELIKKGEKTVFLNLDIEGDKQFFSSQAKLIQKIKLELGKKKGFIFIDEIQRKENAGLFLKGLYDMNLPYKFIVSGSGSLELKEKIYESLVGRKKVFELNPLSFSEFVNFKTNYQYADKLATFFKVEKEKARDFLTEYLSFGGYPRVVLAPILVEKRAEIEEIYHSYVEKDIFYLLKVEKEEAFLNLVRLIANQVGQPVNYSELSGTLGISVKTVKDYLWYLEKTFILQKITPFFRSLRKEITKAPVYYFYDLGLMNFARGTFGSGIFGQGFLFQNFIYNRLEEEILGSSTRINYWRTKDGAEVDFILNLGTKIIPIEVKFNALKKIEIPRSLRSFISKYQPDQAFIFNLSLEKKTDVSKTKIKIAPFYQRALSFPRKDIV